ncbi:ribonuclease HII [Candidatus Curtissbacteria bacterium]|nr:ribonuclease HII [Candidatus Curtissbacteria bacterium]
MILPDLEIEKSLWEKGHKYIAGIDEVGRGSWAGPLVAAGVILAPDFEIPDGLADSKLVKPQARNKLSRIIKKAAVGCYIAEVSVREIDKIGVGAATFIAFRKIVNNISPRADFAIIDAFHIKYLNRQKQMAVKNGDKICASIAAASIIAKVFRDNLMKRLHFKYPDYGFGKHKGYGTAFHQAAIRKHGLTDIHRRSYNLDFLYASSFRHSGANEVSDRIP